jgi:hypothetical protein
MELQGYLAESGALARHNILIFWMIICPLDVMRIRAPAYESMGWSKENLGSNLKKANEIF